MNDRTTFSRRLIIVVGAPLVLGFVNYLAHEIFPPSAFLLDAAVGYAAALVVRKYW